MQTTPSWLIHKSRIIYSLPYNPKNLDNMKFYFLHVSKQEGILVRV